MPHHEDDCAVVLADARAHLERARVRLARTITATRLHVHCARAASAPHRLGIVSAA